LDFLAFPRQASNRTLKVGFESVYLIHINNNPPI